jgi:hypothetical protein
LSLDPAAAPAINSFLVPTGQVLFFRFFTKLGLRVVCNLYSITTNRDHSAANEPTTSLAQYIESGKIEMSYDPDEDVTPQRSQNVAPERSGQGYGLIAR